MDTGSHHVRIFLKSKFRGIEITIFFKITIFFQKDLPKIGTEDPEVKILRTTLK
jgi:hypothetical protein